MDFFESQERARRRSTVLVVLFILATIGIVITVYAAIFLLLLADAPNSAQAWREFKSMADILAVLGSVILAIIGFGTIFKMAQLRRGGAAVAELLGGRLVLPDSSNPDERKVLNVVEEMAIASGLPVPPVYLLDQESGINAFAAGQNPADAVVGLTSGSARLLTRSELQAVIGHEFSHILNGDMRLNIKLMSVIHGLIILGLAGRVILRGIPLRKLAPTQCASSSRQASRFSQASGWRQLPAGWNEGAQARPPVTRSRITATKHS